MKITDTVHRVPRDLVPYITDTGEMITIEN